MGSESVIILCLHKPVYTLFTLMFPVFFFHSGLSNPQSSSVISGRVEIMFGFVSLDSPVSVPLIEKAAI